MTFYFTTQLKIEKPNLLNSGANYFLQPMSHFFGRTYQIVGNEARLQPANPSWMKTAFMIAGFVPGLIFGTIFRIFSLMNADVRAGFKLAYQASITPPTPDYPADKVASDLAFLKSISEATELSVAEGFVGSGAETFGRIQQLEAGTLKLVDSAELLAASRAAKAKLQELRTPVDSSEEKKSGGPVDSSSTTETVVTGFVVENPALDGLVDEYTALFTKIGAYSGRGQQKIIDAYLKSLSYNPFTIYAAIPDVQALKTKVASGKVDELIRTHTVAVANINKYYLSSYLPAAVK
jgi:hypothetical protein